MGIRFSLVSPHSPHKDKQRHWNLKALFFVVIPYKSLHIFLFLTGNYVLQSKQYKIEKDNSGTDIDKELKRTN